MTGQEEECRWCGTVGAHGGYCDERCEVFMDLFFAATPVLEKIKDRGIQIEDAFEALFDVLLDAYPAGFDPEPQPHALRLVGR